MTQARMTAVFEYDLAKHEGNPFFVDTPFGRPLVLELGDYSEADCEGDDLAQAPAPVRVKPLVWDDFPDRGAKAQAWNEANYMIQKWSDGRWEISASYPGFGTFIEGTDRFYPTLEAAKAAAQADYSARILAALEPDAGVVAELVEAVEEAIEALDYSAAEIADLENTLSSYRENWRDAKDAAVSLRAALAKWEAGE